MSDTGEMTELEVLRTARRILEVSGVWGQAVELAHDNKRECLVTAVRLARLAADPYPAVTLRLPGATRKWGIAAMDAMCWNDDVDRTLGDVLAVLDDRTAELEAARCGTVSEYSSVVPPPESYSSGAAAA